MELSLLLLEAFDKGGEGGVCGGCISLSHIATSSHPEQRVSGCDSETEVGEVLITHKACLHTHH